ncbi:MAG: putative glycoside hydrolase [bacterium]|nr:putative glycoside hydrolase [bacterium]
MPVFQRRNRKEYIGFFRKKPFIAVLLCALVGTLYFGLPFWFKTSYEAPLPAIGAEAIVAVEAPPAVKHLQTPTPQKVIYMTSCVVGTPSFRNDLVKLIDETELNSVIIDIKDYTGALSFNPTASELKEFVSTKCMAPDMKEFIEKLHDKDIYVIGRITVFQDPLFTKKHPDLAVKKASDGSTWKDYKGISFTDPGSKEVWDHTVAIAKESYAIGFDELNFDYIRFPSDGPMSDIAFTWSGNRKKADVLESFFKYLSEQLKPIGVVISADLFGMTTTNTDDLNIGQVLEKATPYFDFIAPMVYPSHYPRNFNGWANPNEHVYGVIKLSMDSAVKRFLATTTVVALLGAEPISTTTKPFLYRKGVWDTQKLRPWLQDFDYGGNYDIAEVKAQIQATYDAGLTSWMLWAPSNRYTKGALLPEQQKPAN